MPNEASPKEAVDVAYEAWKKTLVTVPAGDRQAFLAGWHAAKRDQRR
jgi:hypothetical protein